MASRAGVNERYCLEWLRGMASAGYLEHDRQSGRYSLPPEHAQALAQEDGPFFLGGGYQMLPAAVQVFDELEERFRGGGGVSQNAYRDDWWDGMQRFTNPWFENSLVQAWLPAMPEVQSKLEAGARCADVGCGSGRASIKLAKSFPDSRHVGFDISDAQIERAKRNAKEAGVEDRVSFEKLDVANCMTTSLARNGAGLGTCGLPEAKLRELCNQAGFSEMRLVPLEAPFNNLYEIKA